MQLPGTHPCDMHSGRGFLLWAVKIDLAGFAGDDTRLPAQLGPHVPLAQKLRSMGTTFLMFTGSSAPALHHGSRGAFGSPSAG